MRRVSGILLLNHSDWIRKFEKENEAQTVADHEAVFKEKHPAAQGDGECKF